MPSKNPRKRSQFEWWVGQTSNPVFVIAADQSVVYFNAGCEKLTGWSATDVLGQTCQYATTAANSQVEAVTGAICPPPEVWRGQELQLPAYLTPKHGAALPRLIHFFPLRGPQDKVAAVLGIVTPLKSLPPAPPVSPVLQLHAELAAIRGQLRSRFGEETLVTRSAAMSKVLAQLELAIQTTIHACLTGLPGTGKEHLARIIHDTGALKAGWFVPIECDQLSPDEMDRVVSRLIEVHLAGITPGVRPQPGTIYLAEVELLPRDLQEKLVIALKNTQSAEKPGLRIISSGKRPLSDAVAAGTLRADLESRLTTLVIELPPLAERQDDLPVLAQHFLEEHNRRHPKQLTGFAADVWPVFSRYQWPGNLDELRRVIQEASAVAADVIVKLADLPFRFRTALQAQDTPPTSAARPLPLDDMLTRVETNAIQIALERSRYNKTKAAEMLGVNRARLYRRMEQLGIEDREAEAMPDSK
ncbi:MAG: sigma 54-interacting transcriptional regulator [Planctomycetota bacterium]